MSSDTYYQQSERMDKKPHNLSSLTSQRSYLKRVLSVLGILALIELIAVSTALFSGALVPASRSSQAQNNQSTQQESESLPAADKTSDVLPDDLLASIRPRTVEEMLKEAEEQGSNPEPTYSVMDHSSVASLPQDSTQTTKETPIPLSPRLAELLKEARNAQIEGDMRKSILKLEEASGVEPNNPVLLYYFGLAYEAPRNADKSREYFLKVFTMRDKAGKYFNLAAKHLETGFEIPADKRGSMAFGTILEYKERDTSEGQRVVLTVPILMKKGLNIRPEDLQISVHFFDLVNGTRIEPTRAERQDRWNSEPVDWSEGEETLEVRYFMPQLNQEELTAYGDLKYYGFTTHLYYKGEPMDCFASPRVLFLHELMLEKKAQNATDQDYGDGLLPPIDAEQMSDSPDSLY